MSYLHERAQKVLAMLSVDEGDGKIGDRHAVWLIRDLDAALTAEREAHSRTLLIQRNHEREIADALAQEVASLREKLEETRRERDAARAEQNDYRSKQHHGGNPQCGYCKDITEQVSSLREALRLADELAEFCTRAHESALPDDYHVLHKSVRAYRAARGALEGKGDPNA